MRNESTWILFLIFPSVMVMSRPVQDDGHAGKTIFHHPNTTTSEEVIHPNDEEVISVSITSSIAIGRGNSKPLRNPDPNDDLVAYETVSATTIIDEFDMATTTTNKAHIQKEMSLELKGANVEFIKQLQSKKEARGSHLLEQVHPFQLQIKNYMANETSEFADQKIKKEGLEFTHEIDDIHEDIRNIPLGRSVAQSPASQNYIQGLSQPSERGQRLTTVSFNIVHDTPKTLAIDNYNERSKPAVQFPDLQEIYSEPPNIYSQPAKIYSEPARIYSEPAKIYSEPAKIYSEPAKIYSEPAKIYSEPAKFYSPAASLNLPPQESPIPTPLQETQTTPFAETTLETTPASTTSVQVQEVFGHEKNYDADEKDSELADGQRRGAQESSSECKDDNCKVGYVVEGRQYRKYRVEERTADGFIVGEYGVVRNEDGALRGVRYTADGAASPRLIHDALLKFLQL